MNITHYIHHPEQLNKQTLHELRAIVAAHPTYQTARLLMLHNLYLLHDATFDEELRRAAVYITDRNVIFNLVEAVHHQLTPSSTATPVADKAEQPAGNGSSEGASATAMATHDYVAYLLGDAPTTKEASSSKEQNGASADASEAPTRQQQLIDDFIRQSASVPHTLPAEPQSAPADATQQPEEESNREEGFFTETLARIYIKQGRYDKALQIIRRLNLNYPEKSRYFADQISFLEKLIDNQQN